jgi:hypothetical protein
VICPIQNNNRSLEIDLLNYANGLVRVGVQSSIEHPGTAGLIRTAMLGAGLEVPLEGRTLDSICIAAICQ